MNGNQLFKKFEPMINKKAYKVSKNFGIEYQEVKSQAMEYFVIALNKYDSSKGSFSTLLFNELNRVEKYYSTKKRNFFNQNKRIEDYEFKGKYHDSFISALELYESVTTELTQDCQKMLDIILDWNDERKPSFFSIKNYCRAYYNWSHNKCKIIFDQLKSWWLAYEI